MFRERVFLVGPRYRHHARHSGYEAFGQYVATPLNPPVDFRWLMGRWYVLNDILAAVARHPWYSVGAHFNEWGTLRHMLRHRDRLYHILYGDSDLWLLRRAHRITGNRLIASFHQPVSLLSKLGSIERIARHLDGVILVCTGQRAYFEKLLPAERVFVVPHGANTEFFHPAENPSAQPVCITIGSHLRDFITLKEAIQWVWKAEPRMRFIVVGGRSDKKSYFPELSDARIVFLDRISDEEMRAALQSARVAVFAFEEATASNALLEAMASGLPIVATDVGGICEYVDREIGILCPKKDPQALAEGILRLLNDTAAREKMAKASRARALELDFRIIAQRMGEVYLKLITGGG